MTEPTPQEQTPKPPIKVKMKVGNLEFEVEGQPEQLEEAMKRILSTVTEYSNQPVVVTETGRPSARIETCKGVIQRLWSEGWFASPRSLDEVYNQMAQIGYHYDRTAVAHSLIDLVKEGILGRDGRPRRYRYAQKRPPTPYRATS
jgi:hypothetical protein